MKYICRNVAILLLLAILLISCTACGASRPVYASPKADKVVATANNVEILYEELYFIAMNKINEMKATYGEEVLQDETRLQELEDFVWQKLLTKETALVSIGYDYGIDVHEGDLAARVQSHIDTIMTDEFEGDRSAYIESLDAMYMTDHYARAYFGIQNYLANEIVLEMLAKGELETSDDAVMASINGEDFIRTSHVFISKTNGLYSNEENIAHAEEIRNNIASQQDATARYYALRDAIGGKYNNDFNDVTGNGYYFSRGEMETAYENAAFALAEYEVSPVLETEDGYYIIMRLPKQQSYIEDNFQTLKEKSYFVTLNDKVEARLAEMSLVKTDFGANLSLSDLPVIHAGTGSTIITVSAVVGAVVLAGGIVFLIVMISRKKRIKR